MAPVSVKLRIISTFIWPYFTFCKCRLHLLFFLFHVGWGHCIDLVASSCIRASCSSLMLNWIAFICSSEGAEAGSTHSTSTLVGSDSTSWHCAATPGETVRNKCILCPITCAHIQGCAILKNLAIPLCTMFQWLRQSLLILKESVDSNHTQTVILE